MSKTPHIVAVIVTLALSTFMLERALPAAVDLESSLIFQSRKVAAVTPVTLARDKVITQDLMAYLKEKGDADKRALSDTIDIKDMIEKADRFLSDDSVMALDPSSGRSELDRRFAMNGIAGFDGLTNADFTVPPGLEGVVNFWVHIFGVYDKNQIVFYNKNDVSVVYSVLDFSDLTAMNPQSAASVANQMIRQETQRLTRLLEKLSPLAATNADVSRLTEEERRIVFGLRHARGHIGVKADELKASLASRAGFAHRMRDAVAASGAYMPEMRRIFRERGLPEELTVIPFVESAFNVKAYSSAGAAGLWQFIAETGKNYLRIDDYVDERYDPILATYAAASHLAAEYKYFDDWALTINGYNTGPGRIQQAVKELGTKDIAKIVKNFRGSGYGFDSRNYYPEFLAALEVYSNRDRYFGEIREATPQGYDYVKLPATANLASLFRSAGLDERVMAALNPGLKPEVLAGLKPLPKDYLVKIPPERKRDAVLAARELTQDRDFASAAYHVVTEDDKLQEIADQYGITVESLKQENGFAPNIKKARTGDMIRLPQIKPAETGLPMTSDDLQRLQEVERVNVLPERI